MSNGDPLMPHLMDLLERPALAGLIVAGGFGIDLKQRYLEDTGAETLIMPVPPARATRDFDVFLRMEVFGNAERVEEMGRVLREELSYGPRRYNWQFAKPLGDSFPDRDVKIDVLSRAPVEGEKVCVRKVREKSFPEPKPEKVGEGAIHGILTAEAFAIERDPLLVPVRGFNTDGDEVESEVLVAHPYAFLNMKVQAAYDWLRMQRNEIGAKPFAEKHPFDVYTLTAMLTETERERCEALAAEYNDHEMAREIREHVKELFADPTSPASLDVRRQIGGEPIHERFYPNLCRSLGCS